LLSFFYAGCGRSSPPSEKSLGPDELYLARLYATIVTARKAWGSDPARAESLFAVVDSTIDSLRIANTMRELDRKPYRWLLVYREIERLLENEELSP